MTEASESSGSGNTATDFSFKFSPKISKKLKDENTYPQWSVEMARLFRVTKLEKHVTGSFAPKPTTIADIPAWQDKTDKALMFMIEYCEEEAASHIASCNDAGEAWAILKSHYEGKTRTHLSALLLSITSFRYDDRKNSMNEHITTFKTKWLMLTQSVATATAGTTTLAAGIKNFVMTDGWKATLLLSTLPHLPTYQNIINNITSEADAPSYATVVLRLKELTAWSSRQNRKEEQPEPAAAFATYRTVQNPCGYCKSKGFPGTSHEEKDCRSKRRDRHQNKNQVHIVETRTNDWENFAFSTDQSDAPNPSWTVDCAALVHITNSLADLEAPVPWVEKIRTAAGYAETTHKGSARIGELLLTEVMLIPSSPRKLISWGTIEEQEGELWMKEGKGEITVKGHVLPLTKQGKFKVILQKEAMVSKQEWHERYGHLPFPAFRKIEEAPPSLAAFNGQCVSCIKAKFTKPITSAQSGIRTSAVGELVHSNICGPLPTTTVTGKKYFITLVDDFSRLTITKAITAKSEASQTVQEMIAQLQKQTGCTTREIRTDHGGEYKSAAFLGWLRTNGITVRPTVAYHSQTNGVPERINRTIGNMMRANLFASGLPKGYWHLALEYVTFIKNRMPHASLNGLSPLEVAKPNTNIKEERRILRAFGEPVYVHTYTTNKLSEQAVEARVVGFTPTHGIYKVLLPNKQLTTAKDPKPRHSPREASLELEHHEHLDLQGTPGTQDGDTVAVLRQASPPPPPAPMKASSAQPEFPLFNKPEYRQSGSFPGAFPRTSVLEDAPDLPRRSSRPGKGQDTRTRLDEDPHYLTRGARGTHEALLTMTEALSGEKGDMWKKAKDREIAQLEQYDVIEWVDKVPSGGKTVDTK